MQQVASSKPPRSYRSYSDEEIARVMALHRTHGGIKYRTAKLAGVPLTTVDRWLKVYGPDYGKPVSQDAEDAAPEIVALEGESAGDRLAALVKLGRIRHIYLDQMAKREVVERTSAKDASVVVQAATAQIQLLTGQATNRSETRVSYVPKGGLRAFARGEQIERKIIDVTPRLHKPETEEPPDPIQNPA